MIFTPLIMNYQKIIFYKPKNAMIKNLEFSNCKKLFQEIYYCFILSQICISFLIFLNYKLNKKATLIF
jgi:hypothetical protein